MSGPNAFEVAEKLLKAAVSEEEYRAAASRAYIASFQHVRDHPKANFSAAKTADDHRGLIHHLRSQPSRQDLLLVAAALARLRTIRNQADYDSGFTFTKGLAEEAIDRAAEIFFDLMP